MKRPIGQFIASRLSQLVGLPLSAAPRAADMRMFKFGELCVIDSGTVGEFGLHVQCPWRIESPSGIVTGRLDLWVPVEDDFPIDESWDFEQSPNLQDVRIDNWLAENAGSLVVSGVDADDFGGASISFGDRFVLRIFPSGGCGEDWRLFRPMSGEPHFVISEGRIETDCTTEGDLG